MADLVIYTVFG